MSKNGSPGKVGSKGVVAMGNRVGSYLGTGAVSREASWARFERIKRQDGRVEQEGWSRIRIKVAGERARNTGKGPGSGGSVESRHT